MNSAMQNDGPLIEETSGYVEAQDACRLFVRSLNPARPRGVVCIVHGLAEHSGRYAHVIDYLVSKGWACATVDLRGHGRSDGRRVHVSSHEQWLWDLSALVSWIDERFGNLPRILLGHSMGGLISLVEAAARSDRWQGLVVSSPALGPHPESLPPAWLDALAKLLSRVLPGLLISSDLDNSRISRDPAVVAAYRSDPLVSNKVSARWYTEFQALMKVAQETASDLALPALVMQSGEDRLVDPEATRRWAAAAPVEWVEYVEWHGLYHEMLNEPEQGLVLRKVASWLDELIPPEAD